MTKKRKPSVRLYLGARERNAMDFLKHFPDFAGSTDKEVLKTCLMIVAVDAKLKLEEAKKKDEEATTTDTPVDDGVRGPDTGGEDSGSPEEVST